MFLFHVASLCVFLLASFSPVYADTKTLTADASYIMGDGETPSFAEAMALQKAKQSALEEAGTYVQSYTRSVNLITDLIRDDENLATSQHRNHRVGGSQINADDCHGLFLPQHLRSRLQSPQRAV